MRVFQRLIKLLAMIFAFSLTVAIVMGLTEGAYSLLTATGLVKEAPADIASTSYDKDFSELELKIGAAELKIQTGDKMTVEADKNRVDVTENGSKMTVEEKSGGFGWFFRKRKVTVTIPKDHKYKNVKIDTGAGKVSIDELNTESLDLNLGAGEVDVKKLSVDDADIDCGVGKVSVELTGEEDDYSFKLSKGLGSLKLNSRDISDDSTIGDGSKKVKIDGGVGAIDVKTTGHTGGLAN